jgi:hypothetical protein
VRSSGGGPGCPPPAPPAPFLSRRAGAPAAAPMNVKGEEGAGQPWPLPARWRCGRAGRGGRRRPGHKGGERNERVGKKKKKAGRLPQLLHRLKNSLSCLSRHWRARATHGRRPGCVDGCFHVRSGLTRAQSRLAAGATQKEARTSRKEEVGHPRRRPTRPPLNCPLRTLFTSLPFSHRPCVVRAQPSPANVPSLDPPR